MDKHEQSKPPSIREALREIARQVKTGFVEALAAAKAERAAQAGLDAPVPTSSLTAEEQARLERLLQSWPKGREDAQA